MTRDVARRLCLLFLRAGCVLGGTVVAAGAAPGCYSAGAGTAPPTTALYFPVGLAVSHAGNALYAVNSDFDLQWNGGTLQSYNLFRIRQDAQKLIDWNAGTDPKQPPPGLPFVSAPLGPCLTSVLDPAPGGTRIPLGQACAPPVESTNYVRSSTVIGAFATDLQLQTNTYLADGVPPGATRRLFTPVRGDATLTWADVDPDDDFTVTPVENGAASTPDPFTIHCGADANGGRCDARHQAGNNPADNTRNLTLPGEPFGMAQTQDGTAIAVTHQIETDTSLFTAGSPSRATAPALPDPIDPSMQFIVTNVENGGNGITFVPHSPDDYETPPCESSVSSFPDLPGGKADPRNYAMNAPGCVRPAFLQTSHTTAELDLLRYYGDNGSSNNRPFLVRERAYNVSVNFGGADSRGVVIDPTPRLTCRAQAEANGTLDAATQLACARLPARVFFANRTPASLVVGQIGATSAIGDKSYDPDQLVLTGNVPLPDGPSRVYLAPIVNLQGQYELRVFVVNFDSSTISIYDPNHPNLALIDTIYVGAGPFAMAFDPFVLDDVARNATVGPDTRQTAVKLNTYRFAYVASFTQSYIQVIDLDERKTATFESVVFTLGTPTKPKGT